MNDWSRALPAIQYIFNTTRHRDIGYTSAELLFGPANNMRQFVTNQQATPALEAVGWWDLQLDIHRDILNKALELQRNVDDKRVAQGFQRHTRLIPMSLLNTPRRWAMVGADR